jgi:hypothetical protein
MRAGTTRRTSPITAGIKHTHKDARRICPFAIDHPPAHETLSNLRRKRAEAYTVEGVGGLHEILILILLPSDLSLIALAWHLVPI